MDLSGSLKSVPFESFGFVNIIPWKRGACQLNYKENPLDYEPFTNLMSKCYLVLTDSGGIQEEAPSMGEPVLVLRETTERPEAIQAGTVKLVGTNQNEIVREANLLLRDHNEYQKMANAVNPYGDGKAAERILQALRRYLGIDSRIIY
jgi:UDP-N-acetylglucosamine 2-epimerase (non-hydrolysing)